MDEVILIVYEFFFQITEVKAKAKWRKLKEQYQDARLRMATSGESFSNFKYFEEMDRIFGDNPISRSNAINVGLSAVNELQLSIALDDGNENEHVTNSEHLSLEAENYVIPTESPIAEQITRRRTTRLRRRRETNVDKLINYKEKELEFKKMKFEERMKYLKERDEQREKERNRRHCERRADFLMVHRIDVNDIEPEYLDTQ